MIGGTKDLAFMDKDYFKKVLEHIKPSLMNITSIDDVQNKTINLD